MGQQQLLLLILVFIIVGTATIVAINTIQTNRMELNQESIRQEMIDAASFANAYYMKPEMLGGGGRSFSNISLEDLGIEANGDLGEFSLTDVQAQSFKIEAVPAAGSGNIIGTITLDGVDFEQEAAQEN